MTKAFSRWVKDQGIPMETLIEAMEEVENGLFEAHLGSGLIKKRIPSSGRGKRGGSRVLICLKNGDHAILIFGFPKNEKESLTDRELHSLKAFSKTLLEISRDDLSKAVITGTFLEVIK